MNLSGSEVQHLQTYSWSIVSGAGTDLPNREMLNVLSLMAKGNAPARLESHIQAEMNVGVSTKEIIEIMFQTAVYAGVPACMNGISAAEKALAACLAPVNTKPRLMSGEAMLDRSKK